MRTGPVISVVIATADSYESIALTMRHLRAQTVRDAIEVVIVGPSEEAIAAPAEELAGFWGHQLVPIGTVTSVARSNAAGVRRARAPVIVFAEDHCFPEPRWAERLVAAHEGPWEVVGPAMRNANPATMVSWSDFVIGYGPWMYPAPAGPAAFLPGHNSSYKRSVLLDYGDDLENMLQAETVLHFDLSHRGHQLYLESNACAAHTNFALLSSWLPVQFYAGRVFAASRASQWGIARRILFCGGSPLIPVVRLWRCLRELTRPGRPYRLIPRMLPFLCAGLALDGLGQMMGYLFGPGSAVERVGHYEFHRFLHIPHADLRALKERAPV
jgi:hypothetical protein